MFIFAQGFAPVLRRAAVAMAIAMVALPLAACSDEGKLVLHTSTGDYGFNVEVVDTPESRAKGLMFVQELADDAGMLFDFKEEREVSFWMRNTSIPSEVPVQFVLEIPGGRSVEIGLEPGDTMEHALVKKAAD